VRSPSGPKTTLGSRRNQTTGAVSWLWRTSTSAALGRWTVTVSCGAAGRAKASIVVVKRPVPAAVTLQRSGFSQRLDPAGGSEVDYGLVLRNASSDEAALTVSVTVSFLDAANAIIKTESNEIAGIPKATTYYFGDDVFMDAPGTVARLETTLQIGDSSSSNFALPPVSNLRTFADPQFGQLRIDGEFSNPYTNPLADTAAITAVVFGAAGNVVGGSMAFPDAATPPGGRQGFELAADAIPVPEAGSVQVSVEPLVS